MSSPKLIFVFVLSLFFKSLSAQNINGFPIFVMKDQLISVSFHSEVTGSVINPPYHISFIGGDTKTIYISTEKEVKDPYSLRINEGGRIHKFIILYKQYVDPSNWDFDYSDITKLKTQIASFKPLDINSLTTTPTSNTPESEKKNLPDVNSSTNTNFYVLIDEGDKAKKNGDLQTAKNKYAQALQMQPDNSYVQTQLQNVNQSLGNDINSKYNDAVEKAKHLTDSNKYDDALQYLNIALQIKPADAYATSQLAIIKNKAETAKIEQAKIQQENLFNSYLNAGDKALFEGSYSLANDAYNEALKIKPGNVIALGKITSVHQKQISDSIAREHDKTESLFASFLRAGNTALNEKSYASAKLAFTEALKIKPTNAEAKSKLSMANQLLYTEFYNLGSDALNKRAYDEAKEAFNEALKIKPNDVLVLAKLNLINKIKAQDEADNNFNNYVTTGDKALNEKLYQQATIAYTEALKIKPGDVTIKSKLNSIAQKIINDSLDANLKKNEDLYASFIAAGKKALNTNLYDEAKLNYEQALKIKPGDATAKEKLELVNDGLFTSFVKEGDDAFINKQYNKAVDAYANALKLKPNSIEVNNKLAQIDKAKAFDKVNETYMSYMDAGDKAFNSKLYNEAKTSYSSAIKLKPGDSMALSKINSIDEKIALDSMETEQLKKQAIYKGFIATANIETKNKRYNEAIFYYTQALKLIPGDKVASSEINNLQQLITQEQTDSLNKIKNEQAMATANTATETKEKAAASEIENSMLLIKARLFKMGSDVGATDEAPMHVVQLDSFYIGKFEVTQSQWQSIIGSNPSAFKDCDDCPVENVSWYDVMKFIDRLNQITNKKFRLPTEAEWEYVASTQSKKDNIKKIAWYNDNARKKTHHIGLLNPVYLGAYDMYGNVAEWCSDWYSSSSYKNNVAVNPIGPATGKQKVVRGGDWYDMEGAFRLSIRDEAAPDKPNKKIGFRLAMSIN